MVLLLSYSVWRLGEISFEALTHPWYWLHWTVLIINIIFMGYSEGYRGFHKAFSPRVIARAQYLYAHPTKFRLLFAPFFCMSYFHATQRRLMGTYALTSAIVVFIFCFQYIDQPWRGILDVGVLLGILWGIVSIFYFIWVANTSADFNVDPEVHPKETLLCRSK